MNTRADAVLNLILRTVLDFCIHYYRFSSCRSWEIVLHFPEKQKAEQKIFYIVFDIYNKNKIFATKWIAIISEPRCNYKFLAT